MKTKLITLSICISLIFSNLILAQGKDELKVSYGYSGTDLFLPRGLPSRLEHNLECVSANIAITTVGALLGSNESSTIPCNFEISRTGTIAFNYNRRIKDDLSLGGHINHSQLKYRFNNEPFKKIKSTSIHAKIEGRHINKPKFELYSAAMLGVRLEMREKTKSYPSFHFTVIGFRHGRKQAIFYELGLGTGHLISIGYSIKL